MEGQFSLLQMMSDPEGDRTSDVDTDETIVKLMENLRPREREVLELRFGLGGQARLSLSQVGKALSVSKERVRQIQDRALEKLRGAAADLRLDESVLMA
jgi:RNA polymerase primary sigma factor